MKIFSALFILGGLLVISPHALTFAETYGYVTNNGNVSVVEANNPSEAIAIAANIAPNSGVMVMGSSSGVGGLTPVGEGRVYGYVTTRGELAYQTAETSSEALAIAPNRASNSGVMLVQ